MLCADADTNCTADYMRRMEHRMLSVCLMALVIMGHNKEQSAEYLGSSVKQRWGLNMNCIALCVVAFERPTLVS